MQSYIYENEWKLRHTEEERDSKIVSLARRRIICIQFEFEKALP